MSIHCHKQNIRKKSADETLLLFVYQKEKSFHLLMKCNLFRKISIKLLLLARFLSDIKKGTHPGVTALINLTLK